MTSVTDGSPQEAAQSALAQSTQPVSLAVVNDYELVVRGVHAMLKPHQDRVVVLELDTNAVVQQPVDVALYDTFSMESLHGDDLDEVLTNGRARRLMLYTWNHSPHVVEQALERGISGFVSKSMGVEVLLDAIERVHRGEIVVLTEEVDQDSREPEYADGDWPGRNEGLTARESEILALITQGLSNDDIARRLYLSINTVKTYIRSAYRRMGVDSRSRAVLWGVDHGFVQRHGRMHPQPGRSADAS